MDRKVFFDNVRHKIFGGSLTATQVAGIECLLFACETFGVVDDRHVSYVLATPVIETGATFEPIAENLNYSSRGLLATFPKYFNSAQALEYARQPQRIANRAYANRMGNGSEASGDGWRYRGRGFCQITGKDNNVKFSKLLGIDLVGNPDLALGQDVAAKIAVIGMRDGVFTGVGLNDFFNASKSDWVNARKIINGLDRAADVARFGKLFWNAIRSAS